MLRSAGMLREGNAKVTRTPSSQSKRNMEEEDAIVLGDDELDALVAAVDASIPTHLSPTTSPHACADVDALEEPLLGDSWWIFDDTFELDDTSEGDKTEVSGVSTSLTTPSTAHTPPTDAITVSTAYARVAASRQRSKAEREHLKQRVSELESQLSTLQGASLDHPGDSPSQPLVEPSVESSVMQFWQRLAESELQARRDAVVENLRLREQLEAQLRTARSLMKLLRKRPSDDEEVFPSKRSRVYEGDDDSAIFAGLELNMPSRYGEIDRVFEESGLAGNRTTHQGAYVRFARDQAEGGSSRGAPTWFLEFVNSNVVPFDWEMTSDVAWRAMLCPTIPLTNGEYTVVEAGDDYVKALFTVKMKVRGTDVGSRAHFVARRFVESGRYVLVWALNSVIQGGFLKNQRILFHEEGWSAISPLRSGEGEDLCLTQACGRVQPRMAIRPGSKLEEHVGVLTDVVLDCYHETQRGMYDFTGRLLLDAAARRR